MTPTPIEDVRMWRPRDHPRLLTMHATRSPDPFRHRCGLSQHLRDVPPDELARAAAEAFGSWS